MLVFRIVVVVVNSVFVVAVNSVVVVVKIPCVSC